MVAQPKPPVGGSLLSGSVSLKSIKPQVVNTEPRLQAEVKPLTQEDLERYWKQAAEKLGLDELMASATVRLGDHPGRIEIDAQTTYFADEFKEHRIDVMQCLRELAGMPMLDCRVNPKFVEEEAKLYSANDKYNAMVQSNPELFQLRKLLPVIDL